MLIQTISEDKTLLLYEGMQSRGVVYRKKYNALALYTALDVFNQNREGTAFIIVAIVPQVIVEAMLHLQKKKTNGKFLGRSNE